MFERLTVTRVVATSGTIDTLGAPDSAIVMRTAPDEAMIVGAGPGDVTITDPHAIVTSDAGWMGAWIDHPDDARILDHGAKWEPTSARPGFAQGMAFQLPVKLWIEEGRTLVITPHTVAEDLAARIGRFL